MAKDNPLRIINRGETEHKVCFVCERKFEKPVAPIYAGAGSNSMSRGAALPDIMTQTWIQMAHPDGFRLMSDRGVCPDCRPAFDRVVNENLSRLGAELRELRTGKKKP